MWRLVGYVGDKGLELEFKRRIDPLVGSTVIADTKAADAFQDEVMGAFTSALTKKTDAIDDMLRAGGDEALSAFMRAARTGIKDRGKRKRCSPRY